MKKPARPKGRIVPEGKDPQALKPPKRPGLKRIVDGMSPKPQRPLPQILSENKVPPKQKHPVVQVSWDESEQGWGIRPDGYSFHLTEEDAQAYIKEYWARMPDEVPYEYSRPENHTLVDVGPKLYNKIKKSKNGIRDFDHHPSLD